MQFCSVMTADQSLIQLLEHPLFNQAGISVSVLRLDRLHPVISGNKWMKLLPWLEQIQAASFAGFLTKGGPFSNHVHAAAYTAMLHNLSCTLIIKAKNGMLTPTLTDAATWNARIIYAPDNYDDDKYWMELAKQNNQLFIPMGGEGEEAASGVKTFISNLDIPASDHIFCPVGTGTTLKGLANTGLFRKSLIGINPGINDDFKSLEAELSQTAAGKKIAITRWPVLEKFGKWPPFLPILMNEWYQRWQLETDIVYTAKMLYAFFEMVQNGAFNSGESCMLVHTGGLQGNCSLPPGLLHF